MRWPCLAVLACCLVVPVRAAGEEAREIFARGNELYAAGDLEGAVRHYRQLLSQGFRSPAVHYNLGNAYYRLHRIGLAMQQFEKALALSPRDDDIRANIDFLGSLITDRAPLEGAEGSDVFVDRLLSITTPDQDALLLSVLYVVVSGLVALRITARSSRRRRQVTWALSLIVVPLVLVAGTLAAKIYRAETVAHAVVLEARVDVRSGPGEENPSLFTIHEGLKVRVRSTQGSWSQVSLQSGLNGWIPRATLGDI